MSATRPLLLILALLLPACPSEMPGSEESADDTTAPTDAEVCADMRDCGIMFCEAENQAVVEALGGSDEELEEAFAVRADCCHSNGCNMTACPLADFEGETARRGL